MRLRPLEVADVPTLVDWTTDQLFCDHTGWSFDAPRSVHEEYWHRTIAEAPFPRLVAMRGEELVGLVDLAGNQLGYVIGPSNRWGQGLGTTVARLGLEHGFQVLGLDRIEAEAAETNHASIRILQRLGMTETDQQGSHTHLGVVAPTRHFEISRDSYLRANPVSEGE